MRTKEEMAVILSKRLVSQKLSESTWSDLVLAISGSTAQQKEWLVKHIAQNKHKQVGEALHKALVKNAEDRAKLDVDAMLADDTLSLAELDTLI